MSRKKWDPSRGSERSDDVGSSSVPVSPLAAYIFSSFLRRGYHKPNYWWEHSIMFSLLEPTIRSKHILTVSSIAVQTAEVGVSFRWGSREQPLNIQEMDTDIIWSFKSQMYRWTWHIQRIIIRLNLRHINRSIWSEQLQDSTFIQNLTYFQCTYATLHTQHYYHQVYTLLEA